MGMHIHPVSLDIQLYLKFHLLYVHSVKALMRLRGCAGSPEPLLFVDVISTLFTWAGSFLYCRHRQQNIQECIWDLQFLIFSVSNEPRHAKMCLPGSSTMKDSNQPPQLQKLARILVFWIYQVYKSYNPSSEQQRCWSDCADTQADLCFCCSHMA